MRTGSAKTHQKKRQQLRQQMRARGVPEDQIARKLEALRLNQLRDREQHALIGDVLPEPVPDPAETRRARRRKERQEEIAREQRQIAEQRERDRLRAERERERIEEETYARLSPSDSGYRPSRPDPVTTGAARATGIAAKAARRGTTVTKWQHEDLEAKS